MFQRPSGANGDSPPPPPHPRVTMPPQAQAVPNVYKVQPIVASRIPAGSTYTSQIIVYNPRDSPTLAITEARNKGFVCLGCHMLREGTFAASRSYYSDEEGDGER